ncbi:hypothetical protein ABIA65_000186 [Mycolicibacterium sp. 624]
MNLFSLANGGGGDGPKEPGRPTKSLLLHLNWVHGSLQEDWAGSHLAGARKVSYGSLICCATECYVRKVTLGSSPRSTSDHENSQ